MAGQRMVQGGLGSIFAASQTTAAGAAAKHATYARIGEENAENIRNRFYKKEMESVKEAKLNPLFEQLQGLVEEHAIASAIKVLPVTTILSGLDPQDIQAANTAREMSATPTQPQVITSGAGENAKSEVVPGQPDIPPNPITQGGNLGATSIEQKLAIMDPLTGQAVDVQTVEGQAILNRANQTFWDGYSKINLQVMDEIAKLSGNPFAESAMRNLAQETMNQAGFGVTGEKSPEDQVRYKQEQEDASLVRTEKREELSTARRTREAEVGTTDVKSDRALELGIGDPRRTAAYNAAGYELHRQEFLDRKARERSDGQWRYSDDVIGNPGGRGLSSEIRGEPRYKEYLKENLSSDINALSREHAADPWAFGDAYAGIVGAQGAEHLKTEPPNSRALMGLLAQIAMAGPGGQSAHANAQARRMEEVSIWQPELQSKIKSELAVMRSQKTLDGEWSAGEEAAYHTNPYALYTSLTNPGVDVTYWSESAKAKYREYTRGPAAVVSPEETPTGPLARVPSPEELKKFHDKQAAKRAEVPRQDLPRVERNRAIPKEPLDTKGQNIFEVDIEKMNLDQLKAADAQLKKIISDLRVEGAIRAKAAARLREVRALYSGPIDKAAAFVGMGVSKGLKEVGEYIERGVDEVGDIIDSNKAERKERTRKLLTIPEATGSNDVFKIGFQKGTIGSAKSAAGE
jgi:hypothetical protein